MTLDESTQLALIAQKLTTIENKVDSILDDHEARLRELESKVVVLAERLTIWQIGQVVFTSAVGGVVAWFKRP